ncbi:hypothetical protein DFH11DRAFT_1542390 [Phellopilus nigrolimitatus]|nr:hypothetical protein DFH11DRAFT_1542390 [Phellopilus nigrolimitatus]
MSFLRLILSPVLLSSIPCKLRDFASRYARKKERFFMSTEDSEELEALLVNCGSINSFGLWIDFGARHTLVALHYAEDWKTHARRIMIRPYVCFLRARGPILSQRFSRIIANVFHPFFTGGDTHVWAR